jgi:hypothetical protein
VARKIFERSIFLKYIGQEECKLANSQAGFRPGRNTQQQVMILNEDMTNNKCETALMDFEGSR